MFAARYVGAPFHERGRDPEGWDCWGLVHYVLREQFGIDVPSYADEYHAVAERTAIAAAIDKFGAGWTRVDAPAAGDVALFRVLGLPLHVGLVVDPPLMLHCQKGVDTVLERYDTSIWSNRLLGIYRP